MKIIKFSQSTFIVENNSGHRILIDPGKYNYEHGFTPKDFGKVDILIVTHKHEDHHDIVSEKEIIKLWNPTVITNYEIASRDEPKTLAYIAKKVSDKFEMSDFKVTFIAADHFAKCEMIVNFGLFIEADGVSFYHTSDTRFMESCFYDYELVKGCTVLSVPISNRGVVMGLDDSIVFTSQIEPKIVVPMHYDGPKDRGRITAADFVSRYEELKPRIENLSKTTVCVLDFNKALVIS